MLVDLKTVLDELVKAEQHDAAGLLREKLCPKQVAAPVGETTKVENKNLGNDAEGYMKGGNSIPRQENGATYHLGVKEGEIHPRILTVGSPQRARAIARKFLENITEVESNRQMVTVSGTYKGVNVSICACLMGSPNFDMFFREAGAVLNCPLAIIRLGTCGLNNADVDPGTIMVARKGAVYAFRNYLHFDGAAVEQQEEMCQDPYFFSAAVLPDETLTDLLVAKLHAAVGKEQVYEGLNACGESFYSTQGRIDPLTVDKNEKVLDTFDAIGVDYIDMETHQMLHLSKCRKLPTLATGCAIGIVNRKNPSKVVTADMLHELETLAGQAVLDALVEIQLPSVEKNCGGFLCC
eukprot:GDKJ01047016.1.p1 GENE.GDKJ01047016.1~~GDKJ01047016.1.p1  ORF type:complete len:351 (-),score=107.81 GDKJ01047016.1:525-1577(-)